MKDPFDMSPGDVTDMRREYEETVLRFLAGIDKDPEQAITKLGLMCDTLRDMLLTKRAEMTHLDASAAVAMMDLSVTPIIMAQWRVLMRKRTNNPEKNDDQPHA